MDEREQIHLMSHMNMQCVEESHALTDPQKILSF